MYSVRARDSLDNHQFRFLTYLSRDGVAYFLVIGVVSIANLVLILFLPFALSFVGLSISRAVQSTACSRLFLNLRGLVKDPFYISIDVQSRGDTSFYFRRDETDTVAHGDLLYP
ncbi:hypothetical protein C8J56DRAFT_17779 [Mycena floridula]|nr:hypothetical protein C8J56DRAFT_17779 [Mycena floridula]